MHTKKETTRWVISFSVVRSMRLLRSISAIRACAPRGALRLCCSAAAKIAPPERFSRALHGRGFQVSLLYCTNKKAIRWMTFLLYTENPAIVAGLKIA